MKTTLRQIQLPGRVRLEFAEQGERSGLPVIAPLEDPVPEAFAREFRLSTLARPIAAAWLAGFIGDDFSARLREIDVPALIVWGRRDLFCPAAEQQVMLQLIRGSHLVEYADAGHALHWEEPQRFAHELDHFVHSVAAVAAIA